MDSGTFTFHILSIGLIPTQATQFLNHLGFKWYYILTIYRCQNAIYQVIIDAVNKSIRFRNS